MVEPSEATLGKYKLLAKLATGGMAEIFAAKRSEGDVVVVKRILPQYADHPQFVQMFLDEARIASRIRHPNVCQVFELGRIGKQYFIAMELLEGVTLARLIARVAKSGRRIDIPVALGIIVQACEGLHVAHELKGFAGRPGSSTAISRRRTCSSRSTASRRCSTSGSRRRRPIRPRRAPARSRASPATCRPSRCAAPRSIGAATCSRSRWSATRP